MRQSPNEAKSGELTCHWRSDLWNLTLQKQNPLSHRWNPESNLYEIPDNITLCHVAMNRRSKIQSLQIFTWLIWWFINSYDKLEFKHNFFLTVTIQKLTIDKLNSSKEEFYKQNLPSSAIFLICTPKNKSKKIICDENIKWTSIQDTTRTELHIKVEISAKTNITVY